MRRKTRRFGPAWEGWDGYRRFAETVKADLRYVRSKDGNDFLRTVLATYRSRKLIIRQEHTYWRARLGFEHEEVTKKLTDRIVPYAPSGMKPVSNWLSEGRVNPRGIPSLYLASTRNTALAEVRPWIGSRISVAEFRIQRNLNVIDCSKHHSLKSVHGLFVDQTRTREDGISAAIDRAFDTPVSKDDQTRDYIPTQIVAELFKSEGFDGILYKSLLSKDGFNLALFNLEDASVGDRVLCVTSSIGFKFEEIGHSEHWTEEGAESNSDLPRAGVPAQRP